MAHRGGSFPRELVEAPKKIPVDKLRLKTDEGPKAKEMRSHLGRLLRVTLTDGRIITGRLRVFDKHKNLVLAHAVEAWTVKPIPEPIKEDIGDEPEAAGAKKVWQKKKRLIEMRYEDLKNGLERRPIGAVLLSAKFITKVEVDLQSEPDVKPSSVPAAQMGDEFDELKREEILYYGDDVGKKGATSTAEEGNENK